MKNINNIITVIDYIENHLSEKMSLSSIAGAVGYSKYHLHRMFATCVGMSIHNYVQRRQLTEAAKLLVFSDKSILEISLIAGYESQQSFSTSFKQMYKKSPNEYRVTGDFYPLQLKFDLDNNFVKLDDDIYSKISFATREDIPLWLDLVALTVDGYPHLDKAQYLGVLEKCIDEKRALILKGYNTCSNSKINEDNKIDVSSDIAIAAMAINYDTGSIDFFSIHPLYRKFGIAKLFLDKVMNELLINTPISITTFRDGDKADTGYRETYKQLGFAEGELLVEFGYPTQKFIIDSSEGGFKYE